MLKRIFEPFKIGTTEIKNRLIVSPMVTNYCAEDGTATEQFIAYHEARAKGGWGMIITENYAVDPSGRTFTTLPGLWNDDQIPSHKQLTDTVHKYGTKIIAEIVHGGRQTTSSVTGMDILAPSAIPCPDVQENPREMTTEEVDFMVTQFGDAALRAKKAGFDGVDVHGAHGYLIGQFMSHYSNKRTDKYGGSFMNRMRFPLDIVRNIRKKCGDDFIVDFKISAEELVPGGTNIEDTKAICMLLEEAGVSSFTASVGVFGSMFSQVPCSAINHGWIADYANEIKKVVSVPVFAVGRINEPNLAEAVLASGKADAIVMGRASLADPEMPNKAKEGRFEDIIHCIGCMQGCTGRIHYGLQAKCTLNPQTGCERERAISKAEQSKKVIVIGGGPGGAEAAIVAAHRGHSVELYESQSKLGGQYLTASIPPWKGEITSFLAWQKHEMEKLGVNIHLNTEFTAEMAKNANADAIIVATGSNPILPPIPGIDNSFVATCADMLNGKIQIGGNVAVIGGGMIGSESANHLVNHGKTVTIIEMQSEIAKEEHGNFKYSLFREFRDKQVEIHVDTAVQKINEDGTIDVVTDGKAYTLGKFDNVFVAVGMRKNDAIVESLKDCNAEIIVIGDAREARKAIEAIEEGYDAGLNL